MTIAARFFVSGRVQGVFFRASTRRQAEKLGLRGWAVNLPDGRVEVLAVGESAAVAALGDWLQDGPPSAKVLGVDTAPADAAEVSGRTGFSCG
jgi:acylphosphatase